MKLNKNESFEFYGLCLLTESDEKETIKKELKVFSNNEVDIQDVHSVLLGIPLVFLEPGSSTFIITQYFFERLYYETM